MYRCASQKHRPHTEHSRPVMYCVIVSFRPHPLKPHLRLFVLAFIRATFTRMTVIQSAKCDVTGLLLFSREKHHDTDAGLHPIQIAVPFTAT